MCCHRYLDFQVDVVPSLVAFIIPALASKQISSRNVEGLLVYE